ncbi:MAG: hypothetical protein JJU29_04215 [Verrucomicrobia bacterium]|nr:hypothetical protein [Verrucomicrobiota bacterium]MCH8513906.1 hypothetical protein [Kiritimatiellia bacterium]
MISKKNDSSCFTLSAHLHRHQGVRKIETRPLALPQGRLQTADAVWQYALAEQAPEENQRRFTLGAEVREGEAKQISVSLDFGFPQWSEAVHVLSPGAVYNGNRFPAIPDRYPPLPPLRTADEPDQRPRITRVPRLSVEAGASRIEIPSSDPAIPGMGFWFPKQQRGVWFLTPERNTQGVFGYTLEENEARNGAVLRIGSPCVREHAYEMTNDQGPSPDQAADLVQGDRMEISVLCVELSCASVQDLYDALVPLRNAMVPRPRPPCEIPLSAVWEIQEEKLNRENWVEAGGYYAVGVEPMRSKSIHQDWQAGWVGGMIFTHALYLQGDARSRERVRRNFDFLFEKGQAPSGFFYGVIHKGRVIGDHFRDDNAPWHLLRKSADVLFYGLSTLAAMPEAEVKAEWKQGFRACADAFVRLWDANGQLGQFVDHNTGELLVSGSLSAGIAPAGLVLASRAFPERAADYLRVAVAAAEHYDSVYLRVGLTNGGPGEIAQCPDSESVAGLLESLVTLAEETEEFRWVDAASRCAAQAASWVFSYDAAFPDDSTFGKLGMRSAGTVLANVQNKHSAPGICTHSGLSLLRLYRLSQNTFHMDLLRDIARALPQYMSRADRPIAWKIPYNPPESPDIRHLKPGWMCERVNVTQWGPTECIGEVFYYSCWCEASLALTRAELPGVYARPDTGAVWCLDAVEAAWTDDARNALRIQNPTAWPARVRVWFENGVRSQTVDVDIAPGETAVAVNTEN